MSGNPLAASAHAPDESPPSVRQMTESAHTVPSDAAHLAGILVLHDGTHVRTRPIEPRDTEALRTFHSHLSRDTIIYRFFRYLPELSLRDAEHFTHVDYDTRMALVATLGDGDQERLLAMVQYDRLTDSSAEVAFVVADEWQGHGIATALLLQLAAYARVHGITRLIAITMASNRRMLEVLRHCGYPVSIRSEHSEEDVSLDISLPPAPVLEPVTFFPASLHQESAASTPAV